NGNDYLLDDIRLSTTSLLCDYDGDGTPNIYDLETSTIPFNTGSNNNITLEIKVRRGASVMVMITCWMILDYQLPHYFVIMMETEPLIFMI
ncbi:hypothetical protein, partial [Chryseobacterium sp. CH1]|uniref:hypothetical protein n=1 Tax=Chryseobacterium sp. CH1 TaxID=713551 RepID=UPI001027C725